MPITRHSRGVIIQTLPDQNGDFEQTDYQKQSNGMVKAATSYYQVYKQKIRVPKKLAQTIQNRILEKINKQKQQLEKEDQFVNPIYLMPTDQKSIYLRNTQRQCSLCGGPHLAYQCPLKTQKQMQVNRQYHAVADDTTYSVRIEPIPTFWEKKEIYDMVTRVFQNFEKIRNNIADEIIQIDEQIRQCTDEKERELLECSKLPLEQNISKYLILGSEEAKPTRIVVLKSFQDPNVQFAFIHFKSDDAAQLLGMMKPIRVEGDNIYINAEYKGKRSGDKR